MDGIEVIVPEKEIDDYYKVLSEVEKQFDLTFEHDFYKKIIYTHVNAYIALTEKGKIKRKGFYKVPRDEDGKSEIPLGDAVNTTVISYALTNYFLYDIPIEETIKNPHKYNLHIYDYCASKKISKDYEVYYNNNKVQNMNRYYFSRPAPYLLKRKIRGKRVTGNFEHVNSECPVILFNEFIDKPWEDYKIDYSYYISKTREIIDNLEIKEKQLTLF